MSLTPDLVEELRTSYRNIDGKNLTPLVAVARAARIVELLNSAPPNRALFLTLAAVATAGAQGCDPRPNFEPTATDGSHYANKGEGHGTTD